MLAEYYVNLGVGDDNDTTTLTLDSVFEVSIGNVCNQALLFRLMPKVPAVIPHMEIGQESKITFSANALSHLVSDELFLERLLQITHKVSKLREVIKSGVALIGAQPLRTICDKSYPCTCFTTRSSICS